MIVRRKKLAFGLTALGVIIAAILGFLVWKLSVEPKLVIDISQSFFNDFSVQGDKVYLRCSLTIQNNGNAFTTFRIRGDFSEDQAGRLLRDAWLTAQRADGAELFSIDAHSSLEAITVTFVGVHGDTDVKQNRNLPKSIVLEPVDNPQTFPSGSMK